MGKRIVFFTINFLVAFGVLFASIFRSTSVHYAFSQSPGSIDTNIPQVDYNLPGTGAVSPDDPLWIFEVLRDKAWLNTTLDNTHKAEILILLADKRIAYAEQMANRGQASEAVPVAKKAEIYLESAYNHVRLAKEAGDNPEEICRRLGLSSLKHRQIIEEIYFKAPVEEHTTIAHINDTPKLIYEYANQILTEVGASTVQSPFNK